MVCWLQTPVSFLPGAVCTHQLCIPTPPNLRAKAQLKKNSWKLYDEKCKK